MKLSKAQEKILTDAKVRIDFARSHNFYDWYMKTATNYENKIIHTEEDLNNYLKNEKSISYGRDMMKEYLEDYNNTINGITFVTANTRTIEKLAELGLIEIIETGGKWNDTIKIIGY